MTLRASVWRKFWDAALTRHARIVEDLRARFASRGWKMSENNERQGDVIAGADVLDNKRGSAPGQFLHIDDENGNAIIILLPGPPHELTAMFEEHCFERLKGLFQHSTLLCAN